MQLHRTRSGEQTITVTVPREPVLAGIDPYHLLDWEDARAAPDPHGAALEFARSAFRHTCSVCNWDPGLAASAEGAPPPVN